MASQNCTCASADWMDRNLFHRVEVAFPITDQKLFRQIYDDGLISYLNDTVQAWQLDSSGNWSALKDTRSQSAKPHNAQAYLLEKLCH